MINIYLLKSNNYVFFRKRKDIINEIYVAELHTVRWGCQNFG